MARKKRTKELSMRKVREVLRLAMSCNMGNREIARSCSISHVTVGNYLSSAKEAGLTHVEVKKMDDDKLKCLLKGDRTEKEKELRPQPDCEWVHQELKKKGVTLQLLWQEYKERHIVVPDNLKSGVSKACRYEPDINTTYHDMAVHYGTAIIPARVRKPKDKAKVEAGVQVVERWILAVLRNREFFSLRESNEVIFELLYRLNRRPFKKLKGSRLAWFEKLEKDTLRPLPQSRYEFAEWKKARINIDYHVELKGHYYSVPYQLVREEVELRYTSTTVEVFYRGKRIASHMRDNRQGHHTTHKEHMPKSHQEYLEWTPSRIIKWAGTIGETTAQVVETIISSKKHPEQGYRPCLGIIRLGKRYGNDRLEAASKRAIAIQGVSYSSIKSILEKGLDRQLFSEEKRIDKPIMHNNIRGSGYYH